MKSFNEKVTEMAAEIEALRERVAGLLIENSWLDYDRLAWVELYADEMGDPEILSMARKSKTPATDAFLRQVRAQGVESGIKAIFTMLNHQAPGVQDAMNVLENHAAELRQGGAA